MPFHELCLYCDNTENIRYNHPKLYYNYNKGILALVVGDVYVNKVNT